VAIIPSDIKGKKEVNESEKWIEPRNEQICRYIIFSEGGKADELKKSFIHDPCVLSCMTLS